LWTRRITAGWVILLDAIDELLALSWDIQWHIMVRRDRKLTSSHPFILGGLVVIGRAALSAMLVETVWARRRRPEQGETR
jgi:hypothetical protein